MSSTLAKAAVLLACLGLFACSDDNIGQPGGSGGTGGTGGSGGTPLTGICGNGIPEVGEDCDDANTNNQDECLNDCTFAECGDGYVLEDGAKAEECDDGLANSNTAPDRCRMDCVVARCGDNVVDTGEECDVGDGLSVEPGGCRPAGHTTERGDWSCMKATCGDKITDPGEACDDGNLDEYDGCTTECTVPVCGNGVIEPGEACDDGTNDGLGGCNPSCQFASCGDGYLDPRSGSGEECDPDPLTATQAERDDCTVHCKVNVCGDGIVHISKEQCDSDGPDCIGCMNAFCGDGVVDLGSEECDDRQPKVDPPHDFLTDWCVNCNMAYCGDKYVHAGVEECDPADESPDAPPCRMVRLDPNNPDPLAYDRFLSCTIPRCGDGIVDFGDQCDDGSLTNTYTAAFLDNTDSCLDTCMLATCGDGYVQAGVEDCDAGAGNSATAPDTCRPAGHTTLRGNWACMAASCGDGVVDTGEECDDGNLDETDGCTRLCMVPGCGNGVIEHGEVCDDGPANSDTAPGACRLDCQPASCGDGVTDTTEECDDGASNSATAADACRPAGHSNVRGSWACKTATCGDGVVDTGEDCDDGNLDETDGCTRLCTIPECGNGVVEHGEACDDGNNGADECVACQPALAPFAFTGFTTLEATMRGEVTVKAALNAVNKADFDTTAKLRWKITILLGTNPAAGVQAFYAGASTSTNHLDWTESIVTGADGVAFFGPETGFTATEAGLDLSGGSTLTFSTLFPAPGGNHTVKLELLNITTPATPVLVGTGSTPANVAAKRLTATFAGISPLLEDVVSTSSFNARLVAAANPTGVLSWRVGLSQAEQPVPGMTIAGLTTGADGQVTLADIPTVAQLKATGGKTVPIPLDITIAGTYTLRVELHSDATGLVGFSETPLTVGYEPVVSTFDFTNFGSRIPRLATFSPELDVRHPSTDGGTALNGQWRVTVLAGAVPQEGAEFRFALPADNPTDHTTWTGGGLTGSNGILLLNPPFALDSLKVSGGIDLDYSVTFPTAGAKTVRFELLDEDGNTIDTESTQVTVAPGVVLAIDPVNPVAGGTLRTSVQFNTELHGSFNPNGLVRWKVTLTEAGAGVAGTEFFHFTLGGSNAHRSWTAAVTTDVDGVALYGPEGVQPFTPNAAELQLPGGTPTQLSGNFTTPGTYALKVELESVSDARVLGGHTVNFTVAPAP